jgi:hypothetical protein
VKIFYIICTRIGFISGWKLHRIYNYENNQIDALYRLIYYSTSALHVSDDVFAHHQEHLTVFTESDSVHPSCCRLMSWMSWKLTWNNKLIYIVHLIGYFLSCITMHGFVNIKCIEINMFLRLAAIEQWRRLQNASKTQTNLLLLMYSTYLFVIFCSPYHCVSYMAPTSVMHICN